MGVGTDRSRLFTGFHVPSARVELGTSWFTAKPAYNLAICVGFNEPYVITCIAYLYVSSVPELAISCVYILWLCKVPVSWLRNLWLLRVLSPICVAVYSICLAMCCFLTMGVCFVHHNHTECCAFYITFILSTVIVSIRDQFWCFVAFLFCCRFWSTRLGCFVSLFPVAWLRLQRWAVFSHACSLYILRRRGTHHGRVVAMIVLSFCWLCCSHVVYASGRAVFAMLRPYSLCFWTGCLRNVAAI